MPERVSASDLTPERFVDADRRSRRTSDPELCAVDVVVDEADWAAHPELRLRVLAPPALVAVFDQSGSRIVPATASEDFTEVDLVPLDPIGGSGTKVDGIRLLLEARTLSASPLAAGAAPDVGFAFVDETGRTVSSGSTLAGGGSLAVADVVLVGDDATPERAFIADVGENTPSVIDVAAAAQAAGVPLTVVPLAVNQGDAWLQDQFQVGWTAGARRAQQVVLHLPRVTNSSAATPGAPNLRAFVDQHLPSDRVGVVKDLWRVPLHVSGDTGSIELDVASSYPLYRRLSAITDMVGTTLSLLARAGLPVPETLGVPGRGATPEQAQEAEARLAHDAWAWRVGLAEAIPRLRAHAGWNESEQKTVLALGKALDAVDEVLTLTTTDAGPAVTLVVKARAPLPGHGTEPAPTPAAPTPAAAKDERPEEQRATFGRASGEQLSGFVRDLARTHSSLHYGGNIEVSPPRSGAPYGTCVTGTLRSDHLSDLVTSRGRNRAVVDVHTDWLAVGHIDEIMSFVGRGEDFAVLRASPALALELLDKAVSAQASGALVTRMLRGRKWAELRSAGMGAEAHDVPVLHVGLTGEKARYDVRALHDPAGPREGPRPYGGSAFHDDRAYLVLSRRAPESGRPLDARYSAAVPVRDALAVLRGTNEAVDRLFLSSGYAYADELRFRAFHDSPGYRKVLDKRLDHVLRDTFPSNRRVPVPVLFDKVADLLHHQVGAVTPDLVNLQTLGDHVLVPRPYGPRMRPADALALAAPVLEQRAGVRGLPDPDGLARRGLTRTWHWTRHGEWVFRAGLRQTPSPFDEEYDEMWRDRWRALAASSTIYEAPGAWEVLHRHDPWRNHPEPETETLSVIANHYRDGFDEFRNSPVDYCAGDDEDDRSRQEAHAKRLEPVEDAIRRANPGVFADDGTIVAPDWVRVEIPENTVDLFELYTQLVLESCGVTVHWIDSWYYHTHKGGIHCGTNVLRRPSYT